MSKYDTLFSPITIGGVKLRTRTLQSGMVSNFSNEDGLVSDRLIAYHVERAKNYVGLQIVGASYIDKQAHAYAYQTAIDRDECIPGLTKLTDAVHEAGGNIGIQIWHGGSSADPRFSGMELVSCSPIPTPYGLVPHELTIDEIKAVVVKFADAAERAKKSGFDLIEIHGTHSYLIDQFYCPASNLRTDEYGGSLENRMRFAIEVTRAIRDRVGDDYPISFRITGDDFAGEAGNTVADACVLANRLVDEAGVQLINVSGAGLYAVARSDAPEALFADMAAVIKESLNGKALVSVANRIKRPEVAEQVLAEGKSDLITMGRALICDPEILTKAKEGREEDIRVCTSCAYCIATMMAGNRTACIQNPMMGHEFEYDLDKQADEKKNVIVVGAGPAGMQAAVVAAKRGHSVTVFEASDELGGKVNVADKPPFKFEMEYVIKNLAHEAEQAGVEIKLNTPATKELILAAKPDAVIVATGAVPAKPPIPGLDQDNVFIAQDMLLGKVKVSGKTVIIGGGTVGIEAADFLLEENNEIIVVEMLPMLMSDLVPMQQLPYMFRVLPRLSKTLVGTKVLEVSGNKVITDKETIEDVDAIVVAAGYVSVNGLAEELKDSGIDVCVVGDAEKAAKVFEATQSAFEAAYKI